jgi:hypothetical protein
MIDLKDILLELQTTSKDHIMVNKDVLFAIITALGKERVAEVVSASLGKYLPDPETLTADDAWFRGKVALICQKFKITQSELARESQIDQGDMSKFEAGVKPFGAQRKEKLITALRALKNQRNQQPQ